MNSCEKPLCTVRTVLMEANALLVLLLRLMIELRFDAEDWQKMVKQFALHLCMTPAPLCGSLQLVSLFSMFVI